MGIPFVTTSFLRYRRPAAAWLVAIVCLGAKPVCAQSAPETQEKLFGQKTVEGYSLLQSPRVQKDLALSRAQILRIIARDQAAEALIETATPPPDPKDIPALTKKQDDIRDKAISDILSVAQQKRLLQLLAQQQGASLLLKKEIELDLKLSDTQRFVLYSIHQETIKKVKELKPPASSSPADVKAHQQSLRRIRLAGFNHMLRALTPEQRKRFRQLLGPPLDLD